MASARGQGGARPVRRSISGSIGGRARTTRAGLAFLVALGSAAAGAVSSDPLAAARARADAGDDAGAVALLEPLRGRLGAPADALALLGSLYLRSGRAADALEVLGPLAERADAAPETLYDAARAARAAGRQGLHRRYLERAAERAPASPAARDLGLVLAQEGRSREAYALLHPWVLEHPQDLDARAAAAFVAVRLGEDAEAESLLAGAPGDDPRVRMLRGSVLMAQGRPQEALALLTELLPVAPPEMEPDVRRMLAENHILTGAPAAALGVLRFANPGDPRNVLLAAEALYRMGETERALEALRPFAQAVREHDGDFARMRPTAGAVTHTYGRFLVASGRHEEALPVLERSLELVPDEPKAWQAYGQALMAAGRADDARRALARFAQLVQEAETRRGVDP